MPLTSVTLVPTISKIDFRIVNSLRRLFNDHGSRLARHLLCRCTSLLLLLARQAPRFRFEETLCSRRSLNIARSLARNQPPIFRFRSRLVSRKSLSNSEHIDFIPQTQTGTETSHKRDQTPFYRRPATSPLHSYAKPYTSTSPFVELGFLANSGSLT